MEPHVYEWWCDAIRLLPVVIMLLSWIVARSVLGWSWAGSALLVGAVTSVTGLISVQWYWDFAVTYAPTEVERQELVQKDGAPQAMAPVVMPMYVAVFMALSVGPVYGVDFLGRRLGVFPLCKPRVASDS